jgi:hypothetical protein
MRLLGCALALMLAWPGLASAAGKKDPLTAARLLYNQGAFEAAIEAAERARAIAGLADSADLIAARAYLERFRGSGTSEDLITARDRLRRIDPRRFGLGERFEYLIGMAEALYLENAFGAAAGVFATMLAPDEGLLPDAREHVIDWWASALDLDARPRPEIERQAIYQRIRQRMADELQTYPASTAASYWLSAAARAEGDLQSAWSAAEAGWVRAPMAADSGEAVRGDLDRLMLIAIIPERSRMLGQPAEVLLREWERFKEEWQK